MAISHEDREWFGNLVKEAIEQRDEKCKEIADKAIREHDNKSIVHNPLKAVPVIGGIAVAWEAIRNIFKH